MAVHLSVSIDTVLELVSNGMHRSTTVLHLNTAVVSGQQLILIRLITNTF